MRRCGSPSASVISTRRSSIFKQLFLIRSRASGQPRPPRDNSDHDILAVVGDAAARETGTGYPLHTQLFEQLCRDVRNAGLGPVDLIIQREAHYNETRVKPGSFANATIAGGIKLL